MQSGTNSFKDQIQISNNIKDQIQISNICCLSEITKFRTQILFRNQKHPNADIKIIVVDPTIHLQNTKYQILTKFPTTL